MTEYSSTTLPLEKELALSTPLATVEVLVAEVKADPEACYTNFLSNDELQRAEKILCPTRRTEFLTSRQYLRSLLAARLNVASKNVMIVQGHNGKPRLASGQIEFNLSRRDRWCAVALSPDCPVGVDIEPIRPFQGLDEIVAHFFPPQARTSFATARPEERLTVFYRWWTTIEAVVKATGRGLGSSYSPPDLTIHQSSKALKGLALAVAAQTDSPIKVDWHIHVPS